MKTRFAALTLALCLALALPASALSPEDFGNGRLSGVVPDGNALLVTDVYNKAIWRVDGEKVTRFAGAESALGVTGEPIGGQHNDLAGKSYFLEPWDIVPFLSGFAVSDTAAHTIRYIAEGRVYTLAGAGKAGSADGAGKSATFNRPTGLAVDDAGTLYVADTGSGDIRTVGKDGRVATYVSGLSAPMGLCWYNGALYVAETGRSRILRVADKKTEVFSGVSTSLAGAEDEYIGGYADAPLASAKFDHPQGVAAGADGTIYVADTGNGAVRAIRDGRVYTLLRAESDSAAFASPRGLAVRGDTLYVTDCFTGEFLTLSLAEKTYRDVSSGAWYAVAVESATRNGIADGTDEGVFSPDATMNRAMFVTMLSRLHRLTDGAVVIDGEASFDDVPADAWFAAPVRWAADADVTGGDGDGFAPNRSISRQELAAMLYRYARSQGFDVSASADALDTFPDAANAASWAQSALDWACARHILGGDDLGRLNPAATATRAQALTMLLRFMEAYSL